MSTNQQNNLLQQLHVQLQRLHREQVELESAIEELDDTQESYRIVGNLMVKKSPAAIKKQLTVDLEDVSARIGSLKKQQQQLREQLEAAQSSE